MKAPWRYWTLLVLGLALCFTGGCSKESKKARYLQRADRYFQAVQFDKAELEYLNVLRLEPANLHAIRQLGLIYFDQGRPNHAYQFLKRAEELDPANLEVRLKLGSIYLAGRKYKEVRDEASFVLQKQPGNQEALILIADAVRTPEEVKSLRQTLEASRAQHGQNAGFHIALATLDYREKNFTNCQTVLKRALEVDPKNAAAHSALGNLYLFLNQPVEAGEHFKAAYDFSSPRSTRRIDFVDFKIKVGEIAAAKTLLKDIVSQAPDYIPALNRQVELALAEKNPQEAAAVLKNIFARDPQNFEALMVQGRMFLAEGDAAKALTHYERVRATYDKVPQVYYQLAVANLATNNIPEATGHLNQAVTLDPDFAEATILLAELNLRKGDAAAAVGPLTELLKKRPQVHQTYLLLGAAHRARNNLESAAEVYRRLATSFPKNPQGSVLLGNIYLLQVKTNLARQQFEKALSLAPNYLPALEQLVGVDLDEQKFDAAFQRLGEQQAKHPKAPEIQILLAKAWFQKRDTNQVEAALRKAIELDPNVREPYVLLARIAVEKKEHQQAIRSLESVIAKNPKDVGALMLLGMIHGELKSRPAERDAYEKVLAVDPRFSPALNNLAYLYSEHFNELDKAYQLAQRARELLPQDPYTADTLGWILFKRQEYPWAINLLQESADKLPKQPDVLFHLAMAQYMMGQEEPARVAFQRALKTNQDFSGKDEAVRRLAVLDLDIKSIDAKSIATLESQVATHKSDPIALSRLGAAYVRSGANDKALKLYEQALALSPKNIPVMLSLVQLHATLNQPQKAMEVARNARTLAPNDPVIARTLGRLALQTDAAWSLSLLQETARQLPDDPDVRVDLANAHFNMGQLSDAETALQTAFKTGKPLTDADAAKRLSAMIAVLQNPSTATKHSAEVQGALRENPGYAPALAASGIIHEQDGQIPAAVKAYEAVLQRLPTFVPAHKRLAALYLGPLSDPQKAVQHAAKARERMPNDPEIAKLLGIAEFKRGDFSRSAQFLKEGSRGRANDAELFYYLGLSHYRLKQKTESKKALDHALALNLPSPLAAEARRILPELN